MTKYKIVRNKDYLRRKTEPVSSIEEGTEIANRLIAVLDDLKIGIGLSANQIGIPKSVSIVRAKKDNPPIILMNPVILDMGKERITYLEGCLSLPGKVIPTLRALKVTVSTLNHANNLQYGPDVDPPTNESIPSDTGLLECICIQHEIDHLNGVLMTDDGIRFAPPQPKVVKYGRNDKVVIEKSGETQYVKYKKALDMASEGWKII